MKKRSKRLIAILLVLCISMVSTNLEVLAKEGVGSLQTSTQATTSNNDPQAPQEEQTWDGVITTDVFEGENYRITYTLTGYWNGGYNANIQIDNTGSETIENWKLNFDYPGTISNIWNAVIKSHEGSQYLIQNAQWNQDIAPGKSVAFGISGNEDFKGFAKQYALQGEMEDVDAQAYSIQYKLNKDWKAGFNSEITITNQSETTLEDWVLEFDYNRTITNIWNGVIVSHEGNHYVIKNAGYNSNIAPNKTITFGFNGKDGAKTDEPSNYKLCSYSDSVIEKPVQELVLSANTQDLFYNEAGDFYAVDQPLKTLSGTISDSKKVKKLSYTVEDIKGTLVKSGTILVQADWKIDPFGLAIGYNKLTLTAMLKGNQKVETSIQFMNFDATNMEQTDIDLTDTDGDGLNNYFESVLGSDKLKADTDGDGLSDFDEFTKVGTDLTKQDTDGNGVLDGDEDEDQDGLNNLLEIQYTTNCFYKDSDGDGFSDGEEVSNYKTNPTVVDTDEDGLSDQEDVELKFSPINPDTDGNGILDGKEVITQTCNQPIDTTRKAGITNVSVQLACDGAIDNRVMIMDTYNLDMKSSDVVGLIGVPVEISTDATFTSANITFSYDESALGETKEEDLCMMWYDEKNDNYILLEDSVLDKTKNTVTYKTTHFSTYLVVDKKIWFDTMRMDLNYRTSGEVTYYDIGLVVDVSGSMSGDRIQTAKTALNGFLDAMMENDRAGLVRFQSYATMIQPLTSDTTTLRSKVSALGAGGGTDANAGILKGIELFADSDSSKQRMIILVCDGDVNYIKETVEDAKIENIKIHCINVVNGSSLDMEQIAYGTGGNYYYAATTADIETAISKLKGKTVDLIDVKDTDKDGLYDVYELNGMRMSNGKMVYTDPNKADSDGDGINDYDAMGGQPVVEEYSINGNTYSCTLNHANVYGKLSEEFIYVDGSVNSDGKVYNGKMQYRPYSNHYIALKYLNQESDDFLGEVRYCKGAAGKYKLFSDKLGEVSKAKLAGYYALNNSIALSVRFADKQSAECLFRYIYGVGGKDEDLVGGNNRTYLKETANVHRNFFGVNSANENFKKNMNKVRVMLESTLNETNTEVYLSLSPSVYWEGCDYHDTDGLDNMEQNAQAYLNIGAFGTYNKADAAVTLHATYDPTTKNYSMEYSYYLVDYYDFPNLEPFNDMNMLGLARSYELYGIVPGDATWNKEEKFNPFWMYF